MNDQTGPGDEILVKDKFSCWWTVNTEVVLARGGLARKIRRQTAVVVQERIYVVVERGRSFSNKRHPCERKSSVANYLW